MPRKAKPKVIPTCSDREMQHLENGGTLVFFPSNFGYRDDHFCRDKTFPIIDNRTGEPIERSLKYLGDGHPRFFIEPLQIPARAALRLGERGFVCLCLPSADEKNARRGRNWRVFHEVIKECEIPIELGC